MQKRATLLKSCLRLKKEERREGRKSPTGDRVRGRHTEGQKASLRWESTSACTQSDLANTLPTPIFTATCAFVRYSSLI